MNTRKHILEFKRKYNIDKINSTVLCNILEKQGYTIIQFNTIENDPDVATLIEALGLWEQIASSKCFTYQTDKYRLVFIHEDLNEDERTIVLAHEEGHIWNRHFAERNIFGNDVIQEYEANEFVHHLLTDQKESKRKKDWLIPAICTSLCIITAGAGIAINIKKLRELLI